MRALRLAAGDVVAALDEFFPQPGLIRMHHLQAQRPQVLPAVGDERLVGVRWFRCSQIVEANCLRLRGGNVVAVPWMSSICRRVKRRPDKVVYLRFSTWASTAAPRKLLTDLP